MSSKTDYLENAVLNHFLRGVSTTAPAAVFVGLLTVAPSEAAASGTEVTGGAYARQSITFGAPSPAGTVTQSADVTFPVASASWGTVVAYAIYDAVSAGNMLYYSTVTPNKAIANGDQAKLVSGAVVVSED